MTNESKKPTPGNSSESNSGGPLYDRFVSLFATHHHRLFGYILVFVRDRTDAEEVFQETAMVLWREFGSYDAARPFMPWAKAVAFNRIREYRRTRGRGREAMLLSEPVLDQLAAEEATMSDELAERAAALNACVEKLREPDRHLVQVYYAEGATGPQVAAKLGRSIFAIRKAVKRIRRVLYACVDAAIAQESER